MQPKKRLFSLMRTGTRLVILTAILLVVLISNVAPVTAAPAKAISGLSIGAQTGSLNAGTAGSATYQVTLTRNSNFPNNTTAITWTVTGLPTGTSATFTALGNWSGTTRLYQMTMNTTAATPAGATSFTVQAIGPFGAFGGSASAGGLLTVNVSQVSQTITFGALANRTYGDPDFNVSATASSGLTVSFAASGNCTVTGTLVSLTGAGSCTITASQAGNASYFPAPNVIQSFTIAKADQTISFGTLADKNMSDADFALNATASSGLSIGYAATGNCTVVGNVVHLVAVGFCTITASQAGDANFNPAVDVMQTFTIAMGNQTITFAPLADKAFGDPDFTVSATASSGLTVSFVAAGDCTVTGDLVHITGVGSCTITASQTGDANFNPAVDLMQTFAIAMGDQTITFAPLPDMAFGDPDFTVSATASSGLTVTFAASGDCTVTVDLVSLTGIGSCMITASQTGDANYNPAADVAQTFTIYAVGFDLFAISGSTALPGQTVTVWGYNSSNAPVTQPGGPTLIVNESDTVLIRLHNELTVDTGLLLHGQDMIPDTIGVAAGGTKFYTFTANRPGTYLYGAGLLAGAQYQSAMGLYGALIVRPATAGQAYADATTAYGDEAVLVLSEIDANLNNSVSPATFDMRNFKPRYFLINGLAYPDTAVIPTAAGNRVLLRYLNAGMQFHSMALLGTHQTVIANDGSPLTYSHRMVAETFGPGQTVDTIVTIPTAAVDGSQFTIYDGSLLLHNSNIAGFGGMMTFLTVSGTPPTGDTTGPVTGNVAYAAGTLTATVNDTTTGGSTIAAAEYYLDSTAGIGTQMNATDGNFDSVSEGVTLAVSVPAGAHTLYVRGQDSLGNWGTFGSVLVNGGDASGPATTGLTLTPNPSNGAVNVALSATGNDSASGGSNIAAAEYTIDGGTAVSMIVNLPATIASLDASIPAATINALSEGTHIVAVRSQDAAGSWGTAATINLIVDKSGPATSNVIAAPNPSNGQVSYSSVTPAVRVTATVADTTAKISVIEGFIDTVGANGTGFFFAASDGSFNSLSENGFADIPLTTIIQLSNGNHTLYVHGKDAAGNWGPTTSTILVVDKTPPAVSSISLVDPNPTNASTVQFLVTFSESVTGVTSSNFALVSGGSVTGASITSVTGSGATRTITVATGSGSGTLGLNLTSATGIKDLAGNALPTAGLPFVGQVYTIPSLIQLYFSTADNFAVPGVGGTADDADIYTWSGGGSFDRLFDGSAAGLAGSADIDAFTVVDADTFYISFTGNTAVPGLGGVAAEDIVLYDTGVWSLYFDGSDVGLSGNAENVDAFEILTDGSLVVSTAGTPSVTGLSGLASQDLLQCVGTFGPNTSCNWNLYFDGSDVALTSGSENVDGVAVSAGNIFLSTSGAFSVTGLSGQGEDVFTCNLPTTGAATACTSFSMFFDGSVAGMTDNLDAFDLP